MCIIVCLYGIPITLLLLKSIGELITSRVNAEVRRFEKKFLNTLEPKHIQTKTAVVLVSSMILLMTAYGSLVPYLLAWTFDEGVYYSFITFSTIGFGDYVLHTKSGIKSLERLFSKNSSRQEGSKFRVAHSEDTIYSVIHNVLASLYCMFGLCVVSGVINSIMTALEETKNPLTRRATGCIPRKTHNHIGIDLASCSQREEHEEMQHSDVQTVEGNLSRSVAEIK